MSAGRLARALLLAASLGASGCRFHMQSIVENHTLPLGSYAEISLGDARGRVLDMLGPPDEVEYNRTTFVFDYRAVYHRSTELEFFVPSAVIPFFDPLFVLAIPRFFFDESETPEPFSPTLAERVGRAGLNQMLRLVPFTSGEEILIVRGHQLRSDRVRLVFDADTQQVLGKSIRLATGEYAEESLRDRVLLQE